jgi:hypothetical protein
MRGILRTTIFFAGTILAAGAAPLFGQAKPAATSPARVAADPSAGMSPDWDVRVILQEMGAHAGRLLPLLDKVDAKAWVAKGASETYVTQLQSGKDQARALISGAQALARQPEKLSAAMEFYFRLQGLDSVIASLVEGTRKYQNPAVAEVLSGVAAENGANRERFQRYIVDLVTEREQQFTVMDREAQRCRGILARQPVDVPKNSGRTK